MHLWAPEAEAGRTLWAEAGRLPLASRTHIDSKRRDGKDIPCKWKPKETRGSYTYIRQKRFLVKTVIRNEEGHCRVIMGMCQGDITTANIHGLSTELPADKY